MKIALIGFGTLAVGTIGAYYLYIEREPVLLPLGPEPASVVRDFSQSDDALESIVRQTEEVSRPGSLIANLGRSQDEAETVVGRAKSVNDLPDELASAFVRSSPPPESFDEKAVVEFDSGAWQSPQSWAPLSRLGFQGFVVIHGHADRVRDQDYNKNLSERRAISVRERVAKMYSIPKNRIIIAGFGEDYPIEATDDEVENQKNRRVEVYVY